MRRQILILLLATGCAAESLGSAPIAGTGMVISASSADPTSSTSSDSTSSDTGEPGPCAAYLGCLEQCASSACTDDCAEITGVDVDVCMQIQCDAWQDACAHDDPQACERLPECAPGHESTSTSAATEAGSSTGTRSTDTGATESSSGSSEGGSGTSSSTG